MVAISNEVDVQELVRGNKEAFSRLYDLYSGALLGVINNILNDTAEAENCLVDCFAQIWMRKEGFDHNKEPFFSWCVRIARDMARDVKRKMAVGKTNGLKHNVYSSDTAEIPTEFDQNKALNLIYIKGYTLQEACEELNMAPDILKKNVQHAIMQLKTTKAL